ncbi:MAG TPA: ring-cleaving dioxygenase [Flavisolibacter sp.]|jgi:glyoxalase family protein|nr:ring-cleaving dioxygenase [Flavisolibacter sp.]
MENKILGLHHITAIAGGAQRNYNFYTKTLGVRLVKKTVNFDDPGTYHFYYGDKTGSPGTILTFFPWEGMQQGRPGTGMATEIGYTVPKDSLPFWTERFKALQVKQGPIAERFGQQYLPFEDPDGLRLNLVEAGEADTREPWITAEVSGNVATKGFHSVVLTVRNSTPTANVLTDIFGYKLLTQEGNRYRFVTEAVGTANSVDIVEDPAGQPGINAAGTNHHVAFRVKDDNLLMDVREKVLSAGLRITEKIDRNYFYSLYFREPGGILFELASDNPGFATDETVAELGTHLMLPPQYEKSRRQIEEVLPVLQS